MRRGDPQRHKKRKQSSATKTRERSDRQDGAPTHRPATADSASRPRRHDRQALYGIDEKVGCRELPAHETVGTCAQAVVARLDQDPVGSVYLSVA